MKKIVEFKLVMILFISFIFITGCSKEDSIVNDASNNNNTTQNSDIKKSESETNADMKIIKISMNNKVYNAILEDNETSQEFIKLLPQEYTMKELNGNEKYIYLNESLPSNPINVKHIEVGDIMLYGNDCIVIFYKSFNTSYSYTKIGHIDNLDELGNSNIVVKFEYSEV